MDGVRRGRRARDGEWPSPFDPSQPLNDSQTPTGHDHPAVMLAELAVHSALRLFGSRRVGNSAVCPACVALGRLHPNVPAQLGNADIPV